MSLNYWKNNIIKQGTTNMSDKENAGQFLQRVGIDGMKWAEKMHKVFPQVAVDDLLGWCCNMIMAGYDEAQRRAALTPQPSRGMGGCRLKLHLRTDQY